MEGMWNPALEALPRDQLRELQVRRFRDQLEYAIENVPFYRQKFSELDVDPGDIETIADVRSVPVTTKAELRDAQNRGDTIYGDLLGTDQAAVTEYHQTSGSSGSPVRQADTWRDWEWWADCWSTVLWAQGIRPEDRVFFPFSYNVFVAFWAAHYAVEKIGAEAVPGGNLSSIQRVRKMDELDVTAFLSTPTYALRLAEVAEEEEGIDPAALSVERIVCAGEPGASVPATKSKIERAWDAEVFDHAGATETGAWGFGCQHRDLALHLNEAQFLVEVLDDDGEPVEPGEKGELVVTPLRREAQPYVRFELNDIVEVSDWGACDCGRSFRYADGGILGRSDDLTKVNGVLVSPVAIEDAVHQHDEIGNRYEVVVDEHDEKAFDVVTVRVEQDRSADASTSDLATTLTEDLKQATGLRCEVQILQYGTLERTELKADNFVDRRDSHDR